MAMTNTIRSIALKNFLSFGPMTEPLELRSLNVVIGPNGSGKSNLMEAFELLRSAPSQLVAPIREGGGVEEWIWKGGNSQFRPAASMEVLVDYPLYKRSLRYRLAFSAVGQRFEINDEVLENEFCDDPQHHSQPFFYYRFNGGRPLLSVSKVEDREDRKELPKEPHRELRKEDIDLERSILAQRRDPDHYPELTWLADMLGAMRLYRDWNFGRYTPPRLPQRADGPNRYLEPDAGNLALVLSRFSEDMSVKRLLLDWLQRLYEGIDDFYVSIAGGTVQVFFREWGRPIPATRLSDGTLRYLCLLAILLNPEVPPFVCIEEPELGLHPDMLPDVAELLRTASNKTQILVTTHSSALVDALSNTPDSIVVAERLEGATTLQRLEKEKLAIWLEKYSLGELWIRGEIGGMRW